MPWREVCWIVAGGVGILVLVVCLYCLLSITRLKASMPDVSEE